MRCVEVTNWVGRVAALSIMLIGCVGDATEPNEKNFAAALNTSLEKEGGVFVCRCSFRWLSTAVIWW